MALPRRRRRPQQPGSTTARGYGYEHQQERKRWEPIVATGRVRCWRCGRPILPQGPFDLGHDDRDRRIYRGPEHPKCNRATSGRRAVLRRSIPKPPRSGPTDEVTRLEW